MENRLLANSHSTEILILFMFVSIFYLKIPECMTKMTHNSFLGAAMQRGGQRRKIIDTLFINFSWQIIFLI